jgi:hypothetical protein
MARARAAGIHVGRPRLARALEFAIMAALAMPGRPGVRAIAKRFNVGPGTVQRIAHGSATTKAKGRPPRRKDTPKVHKKSAPVGKRGKRAKEDF